MRHISREVQGKWEEEGGRRAGGPLPPPEEPCEAVGIIPVQLKTPQCHKLSACQKLPHFIFLSY